MATLIEGNDGEVLRQSLKGGEVIDVGGGSPTVKKHDGRSVLWSLNVTNGEFSEILNNDRSGRRKGRRWCFRFMPIINCRHAWYRPWVLEIIDREDLYFQHSVWPFVFQ